MFVGSGIDRRFYELCLLTEASNGLVLADTMQRLAGHGAGEPRTLDGVLTIKTTLTFEGLLS